MAEDEPKTHDDNDESKTVVPTKIYIQGVDTLHTDDIKAYVKAHFGPVDKVEWIDDSAANLVFGSEPSARDALTALSTIEIADATALAAGETLPAKPVEGRPEISLHVRWTVASDRKQAGAAQRSRYYLLHPEHDPEERRRRNQDGRSRYRERDGDRRRGGGDRRRRGDSEEESIRFDASMYDDAPTSARARRHSDDSDDRRRVLAQNNRGKELFASRAAGRDRSASPLRDDDGDASMDAPGSSRNRTQARSIKGRLSSSNTSKELFPTRASGRGGQLDQLEEAIGSARLQESDMPKVVAVPKPTPSASGAFSIRGMAGPQEQQQGGADSGFSIKGGADTGFSIKGAAGASAKELFPDRFGAGNAGKELLDGSRSKRRQKAQDLFS